MLFKGRSTDMATKKGWWTLELNIPREALTDVDWEHISDMVRDGYTAGEIVKDEVYEYDEED